MKKLLLLIVAVIITACTTTKVPQQSCGELEVELNNCYTRFAKVASNKFGGYGSDEYEKHANISCAKYLEAIANKCN